MQSTVIARVDSEVYSLNRDTFIQMSRNILEEKNTFIKKVLRNVDILKDMYPLEIDKLIESIKIQKY